MVAEVALAVDSLKLNGRPRPHDFAEVANFKRDLARSVADLVVVFFEHQLVAACDFSQRFGVVGVRVVQLTRAC